MMFKNKINICKILGMFVIMWNIIYIDQRKCFIFNKMSLLFGRPSIRVGSTFESERQGRMIRVECERPSLNEVPELLHSQVRG